LLFRDVGDFDTPAEHFSEFCDPSHERGRHTVHACMAHSASMAIAQQLRRWLSWCRGPQPGCWLMTRKSVHFSVDSGRSDDVACFRPWLPGTVLTPSKPRSDSIPAVSVNCRCRDPTPCAGDGPDLLPAVICCCCCKIDRSAGGGRV
jgi:hypothetical protein